MFRQQSCRTGTRLAIGFRATETGAAEDQAHGQEKMMVDDKADDKEECDDCLTPPDGVKKLLLEELQSVGAACAASGDWSKMEGESWGMLGADQV